MKNKIRNKLPEFKSREEETIFWETHSLADYWDEFEDANIRLVAI